MTLYLHIGAQKTGSTTIQEALYRNRGALLRAGLTYPEVQADDKNKVSHYNSLRGFFTRQKDQIADTDAFISRVNGIEGDVLLSSEALSNWPPLAPRETAAQYWARKQTILEGIRDRLAQRRVKVIYCVRERTAYLKSLFKQHLKVLQRPSLSIEDELDGFLKREVVRSDTARQAEIWRKVFGNVGIIDFDEHARAGTLLDAFVERLDRQVDLRDVEVRNVSPDWTELELTRISRTYQLDPPARLIGKAGPGPERREQVNTMIEAMVARRIKAAVAQAEAEK